MGVFYVFHHIRGYGSTLKEKLDFDRLQKGAGSAKVALVVSSMQRWAFR
jgi:hypothetical protein